VKLADFLDSLIPCLKSLQGDENAEPFFDYMGGAFIWTDERLRGLELYEMGCLRAIFRFRTSIVVQEPDERFQSLWNALKNKYPKWIGFAPERCSPNAALAERYREIRRVPFI
jgi:hypothetical protein